MATKAVNNEVIDATEGVSDAGSNTSTASPTSDRTSSPLPAASCVFVDLDNEDLSEAEREFLPSIFAIGDLDKRAAMGLSRLQELRLQLLAVPEDGDVSEASCVEDCHNPPEPMLALASLVENVVGHLYSLARASAMVDRMFFHERVSSGQPDVQYVQQIFEGFVIGDSSDDDDDDCDAPICSVLDDMQCLKFIT